MITGVHPNLTISLKQIGTMIHQITVLQGPISDIICPSDELCLVLILLRRLSCLVFCFPNPCKLKKIELTCWIYLVLSALNVDSSTFHQVYPILKWHRKVSTTDIYLGISMLSRYGWITNHYHYMLWFSVCHYIHLYLGNNFSSMQVELMTKFLTYFYSLFPPFWLCIWHQDCSFTSFVQILSTFSFYKTFSKEN